MSQDKDEWNKAIEDELESIKEQKVWESVDAPKDRKLIDTKWVLRKKLDKNGNVDRYKARLGVRGFQQIPGVDYEETYAPTAAMTTFRIIMALASTLSLNTFQLDIKTAYLNAELKEELFLKQPEGVELEPGKVLKLHKALYGLKQAGKEWNKCFHKILTLLGFCQLASDQCCYCKQEGSEVIICCIYVDDLIGAATFAATIKDFIDSLQKYFSFSFEQPASFYLGTNIACNERGIELNQRASIVKLLDEWGMQDCKPRSTVYVEMKEEKEVLLDETKQKAYRSIIGSLNYLAICTRPDIAYAISKLSQNLGKATITNWTQCMHVLRYLQGTKDVTLNYQRSNEKQDDIKLVVYSDADWGSDVIDRKSRSGTLAFVNNSLVGWRSVKQKLIALSTVESELNALVEAVKDVIWLTEMLREFSKLLGNVLTKPIVFCDSEGAICHVRGEVKRGASRHYVMKMTFIKELVESDAMILKYISTVEMLADFLTKTHGGPATTKFVSEVMNKDASGRGGGVVNILKS
jgi:hypothetical protein